jgi:uncharacterized protein (UPF0335 family)
MTSGADMGGQSKTLLVSYVKRVKALADEIGDLQADITDICKDARDAGFDSTKIREVVRWLRKLDKHGREKMDEAEAIFDLYRSVVDGGAVNLDAVMTEARDRALLKIFAPDDQMDANLNKRRKSARTAATLARAAREAGSL